MKKKSLITIAVILSLVIVALAAMLICSACSKEDKTSWTISADGGEINAYFSDNGKHGYILNVEGTGKLPDYSSAKDAPWYSKAGRVTEIKIAEGITSIGKNAFTQCVYTDRIILPASVTAVGENAFSAETECFAYSSNVNVAGDTVVYNYLETAPTTAGNYWHIVNDIITKWPSAGMETKKILFIGNSFTYYNDMPVIFSEIATSTGASVTVDSITKGSQTLTNWVNLENEDGAKLDTALKAANDYDIIIIQEQSTRPLNNYDQFLSGARTLADKIAQTQTDCKIYLYSTWGYASQAESKHITIPEMESQLRTAYESVATEVNATVSYVGKAFTYVYENNRDINLYNEQDNMHPSYAGSYLSACVHAATILGIDPRTTTFKGNLGESTASVLREVAYNVVFGN